MTSNQEQKRQICLAIDTALNACSLALAELHQDGTVAILAQKSQMMERGHAEILMTLLGDLLIEAKIDYADLNRLAVTVGPGSFTGLRVGLATTRALALALDIPLIGLSSLKALELTARQASTSEIVCAAIDARRGQIYYQIFADGLETEPKAASLQDLYQDLNDVSSFTLIGNAGDLIRQSQEEGKAQIMECEADLPQVPDMAIVAKWALHQPKSDKSPAPLYLRAPDAKPQVGKAIARA